MIPSVLVSLLSSNLDESSVSYRQSTRLVLQHSNADTGDLRLVIFVLLTLNPDRRYDIFS